MHITSTSILVRLALAAACALAGMSPAQARNDTFMQPVAEAMHKNRAHAVVSGLSVRFGADSALPADSPDVLRADVLVEGIGSTGGDDPRQAHFAPYTDEQRCTHAFDDALAKLVVAARQAGGRVLLGVVSDYKGTAAIRDGRLYECHAGGVNSYVWLRAQVARSVPSARPLPPDSGFAALDNADALPLSDAGKERYRHFLTLPMPRAFVVMEDGQWYMTWNSAEAMTKALDHCARIGKRCWLYAANDRVVWNADVDKRIGASSQLGGGPAPVDKGEGE